MARAILTYPGKREAIAFDCRAPMRHIPPMQLGHFTMPLHPPHRDPAQTLQEDREAIVLADRLGFHDAFVGEHLTDRCENVTNSFIFLAIWERDAPYGIDLPGNRYKVTTEKTFVPEIGRGIMYRPYQKPRPEIVGTVVAPRSKGVIAMGERDFHPLSANFLLPHWLPSHWENYAEGKRRAGKSPDPAEWRIARTIFVCDDDRVAERYAREDPRSPYRFYWKQLREKMLRAGRQVIFKLRESEDDAAVTLERLLAELVLCGTVDKVVDQLLALRERSGDFGEIVYAGMDWVDPALARRSIELMANEVMPRVNKAVGGAANEPPREAVRI